jgi:hypothetical protein
MSGSFSVRNTALLQTHFALEKAVNLPLSFTMLLCLYALDILSYIDDLHQYVPWIKFK